jgi:hypothetical protein
VTIDAHAAAKTRRNLFLMTSPVTGASPGRVESGRAGTETEPHPPILPEERAAMLEEVRAGNAAALAKVRAESYNGMAVAAAVRQLEAMRQTIAEETAKGVPRVAPG